MNIKPIVHLFALLCLMGAWAYLWMTPTGNIKPGGMEKHLLLMLFGGAMAVYIFIISKRLWFKTHQPVLVVNMSLASLFVGAHLYLAVIFGFNMAAG